MIDGDFLSAWSEEVAERLARKAAEVFMAAAKQGVPFPQMVEQLRVKFDYQMIVEGQALMRKSKARPNETGRILKVISSAEAAIKRPDTAIVKPGFSLRARLLLKSGKADLEAMDAQLDEDRTDPVD